MTSHRIKPMDRSPRRRALLPVGAAVLAATLAWPAPARPGPPRGPAGVMDTLGLIQRTIKKTRYVHWTRIDPRRGIYMFDCSAMAGWVLERAAPRARRTLTGRTARRPIARDFHRRISRLRPGQRRGAWYRLPDIQSARPGDIVAWIRPRWFKSKNSGHVAFLLSRPWKNPGPVPGYLLRIADSTALPHEDDTRRAGQTGFGAGTILLPTDAGGRPLGYGWYGSISKPGWIIPTSIVIGRALR